MTFTLPPAATSSCSIDSPKSLQVEESNPFQLPNRRA